MGWRVNRRHVLVVRDLYVEGVTHVSVHERSIAHFTAPESRAADHGMLFSVVLGQGSLTAETKSGAGGSVRKEIKQVGETDE